MIDLTGTAASLTSLRAAMSGASSFIGAPPQTLQPVLVAIDATESIISGVIAETETVLGANPGGAGGVIAGGDPGDMATSFSNYCAAAVQACPLRDIGAYLARLRTNITQGAE